MPCVLSAPQRIFLVLSVNAGRQTNAIAGGPCLSKCCFLLSSLLGLLPPLFIGETSGDVTKRERKMGCPRINRKNFLLEDLHFPAFFSSLITNLFIASDH